MTRLVQDRVKWTEDELRKAYDSAYGEKIDGRIILWKAEEENQARNEYAKLRDSEEAFAQKAKLQKEGSLASTGGKLKPIGWHAADPNLEKEAFKLRPGEVSTLFQMGNYVAMFKCDKRIPADTTVNYDSVKPKLIEELREQKLQVEMGRYFHLLKEEARATPVLKKLDRAQPGPMPALSEPVAYIHGKKVVTREELGEYLIARYGAEKLEFLVNSRIIAHACKERNISVSDEEIEAGMEADLKAFNVDRKHFEKNLLSKMGKNLYEWREDVVKQRLLMTKMCKSRVKCTEDDVKKGFEAYYGEKLSCRVILWPSDQGKYALAEYNKIRDSADEFDRKAKSQPSPTLAAQGGRIPPFGRHVLGNDDLEREAFKLSPGEITPLVQTPQGQVVMKLDKRIEPDKSAKLAEVRDKITAEVIEKKVQAEMVVVFKELRDKAKPRMLMQAAKKTEDLSATSKELIQSVGPEVGKKVPGK